MKKLADRIHAFFIPAVYSSDEVTFRKARIFINTTLITSIFAFFFLFNAILFNMPMATISMIVCTIAFFSLAWLMKAGVPYSICTNAYIGFGVVATAWDAYFAGGLNSVHTPWFVFPAIGAILIGTIKQGRTWLIITLMIVTTFGVAAIMGHEFPNELSDQYKNYMATSAYTGLIVILFIIFLVGENAYLSGLRRLNSAMEALKKSQEQLIHQEKLALLGHMAAGIAHEIQNPLNFVNNFSSLSKELLTELKTAKSEEEINDILFHLNENLSKIEMHGNKAGVIIKQLLLQSSVQSGQRELTDLNIVIREGIQLAYENANASKRGIPVEIKVEGITDGLHANMIRHEIGRVMLNVLDNAMYAVQKKMNASPDHYVPMIKVTTGLSAGIINIRIEDNGTGISPDIMGRIFQPFFTTKSPNEGAGLGLNMCYDIVKAHGGDLRIESKPGEGTTVFIQLPMQA